MHLGGVHDEFEFVIAGSPLDELGTSLGLARSGETALRSENWRELAQLHSDGDPVVEREFAAAADEAGDDYVVIKPGKAAAVDALIERIPKMTAGVDPFPDESVWRRYVPALVSEQFEVNKHRLGHWLSEAKSGCVIFVNLAGLNLSTTRPSMAFAQASLVQMMEAIDKVEGFRRQFLVDDKGCTLIAALCGHESDALRAVRCAMDMQHRLTALGGEFLSPRSLSIF
jgi:hypothetical protein